MSKTVIIDQPTDTTRQMITVDKQTWDDWSVFVKDFPSKSAAVSFALRSVMDDVRSGKLSVAVQSTLGGKA